MFRGSRCLLAILAGVMVLLLCRQSASAAVPRQPGGQDDLPPQEIYEQLSPAIVQLTTEWGSGSGILFERHGQKYVVTNHHVLWPYPYADVVFPDGLELFEVPVVDWDVMVDVAVLGPVDVDIPAANISARREVAVGDTAYFIGYPSEWEQFAQPTLSQGIVSRTRDWPTAGASYYQVDAEIAGGQSGGAMVAADGNVVGLTTFFVADDGSFGLALSAEALLRRIDGILRGSDVDKLGERFVLLDDVDDGTEIRLNSHRLGAQDFSGDMDIYFVTLPRRSSCQRLGRSHGLRSVAGNRTCRRA